MFGIGTPELILILVLTLIVLGPSRLPDLARAIGRGMGEFRRAMREVEESIQEESTPERGAGEGPEAGPGATHKEE